MIPWGYVGILTPGDKTHTIGRSRIEDQKLNGTK